MLHGASLVEELSFGPTNKLAAGWCGAADFGAELACVFNRASVSQSIAHSYRACIL